MNDVIYKNIKFSVGDIIEWDEKRTWNAIEEIKHKKGVLIFGEYNDDEGYTTMNHLGFYLLEDNDYNGIKCKQTLPDVVNCWDWRKV